jgi:aconitase B
MDMDEIKDLLRSMSEMISNTNERIVSLERKIDKLTTRLDEVVLVECKKRGTHIDFVEVVYENVKHPLGYICNKFNYLTDKTSAEQLTLQSKNE